MVTSSGRKGEENIMAESATQRAKREAEGRRVSREAADRRRGTVDVSKGESQKGKNGK